MYPKRNDIAEYARKLGSSVYNVKRWFDRKRNRMVSKARIHGMLKACVN